MGVPEIRIKNWNSQPRPMVTSSQKNFSLTQLIWSHSRSPSLSNLSQTSLSSIMGRRSRMAISPLTKAKMIKLGTGFDLWARVVDEMLSTNKLGEFLMVADEAKKDPLLICKHFLPSGDPLTSTQLASNNGPWGTITNVQSDDYPQATQIIKKIYRLHRPSHNHWLPRALSRSS